MRRLRVGSGAGRRRGLTLPDPRLDAAHPPSHTSGGRSDEPSPPTRAPSTAGRGPAISHAPLIVPTRASCRALSPGGECDYVVRMCTWAHRTDVPCMVTYTMRGFDDNGLLALFMYIHHISVASLYLILRMPDTDVRHLHQRSCECHLSLPVLDRHSRGSKVTSRAPWILYRCTVTWDISY